MNLVELFRIAIKSLWIRKLRSFLATLGIVFGVAAVVSMVSINESTKRQALKQFEALGITNIRIKSIRPVVKEQKTQRRQWVIKYGITPEDVSHLCAIIPGVKQHSISRYMKKNVWVGDKKLELRVLGVTPSFFAVNKLKIARGRCINDVDIELLAQVCMLGSQVARQLFRSISPINQEVKIAHRYFKVVGVLQDRAFTGGAYGEGDINNYVFIPYSTCIKRYGKYKVTIEPGKMEGEEVYVDELVICINDVEDVIPASAVVKRYLQRTHPRRDYEVIVPLELLKQREHARRVFNLVMLAIASISLIVGGIGIMNIMLANVVERTREIGTRRALGATKKSILQQFLIESITLTLFGGIVGILVGILLTWGMTAIISAFLQFEFAIEPVAIVISFLIALAVGVIFGTYPAVKAANLSPLEALRME